MTLWFRASCDAILTHTHTALKATGIIVFALSICDISFPVCFPDESFLSDNVQTGTEMWTQDSFTGPVCGG